MEYAESITMNCSWFLHIESDFLMHFSGFSWGCLSHISSYIYKAILWCNKAIKWLAGVWFQYFFPFSAKFSFLCCYVTLLVCDAYTCYLRCVNWAFLLVSLLAKSFFFRRANHIWVNAYTFRFVYIPSADAHVTFDVVLTTRGLDGSELKKNAYPTVLFRSHVECLAHSYTPRQCMEQLIFFFGVDKLVYVQWSSTKTFKHGLSNICKCISPNWTFILLFHCSRDPVFMTLFSHCYNGPEKKTKTWKCLKQPIDKRNRGYFRTCLARCNYCAFFCFVHCGASMDTLENFYVIYFPCIFFYAFKSISFFILLCQVLYTNKRIVCDVDAKLRFEYK